MISPADEHLMHLLCELTATVEHPRGPFGRLCDLEAARGYKRIKLGTSNPFSLLASDWHQDTLLTRDGNDIRIVLITAKHPGQGSFSRLIANIERAALVPVVIAPVGPFMPAILKRWGWVRTNVGMNFGHEDHWRAP